MTINRILKKKASDRRMCDVLHTATQCDCQPIIEREERFFEIHM